MLTKKVSLKKLRYIFFIIIKEICCAFCHFENLHPGHTLIKLTDIDSLKKENITIESSIKEFNNNSLKLSELKNKIEDEINKINNLYEKTIDELTKSFLKRHEKLLKEENEIKEKITK